MALICKKTNSDYTGCMAWVLHPSILASIMSPDRIAQWRAGSLSMKYTPRSRDQLVNQWLVEILTIDTHIAISLRPVIAQQVLATAGIICYNSQHVITRSVWCSQRSYPAALWTPSGTIQMKYTGAGPGRWWSLMALATQVPWIPFVLFNVLLLLLPTTISNILGWINMIGLLIVMGYFGYRMLIYFRSIVISTKMQRWSYDISIQQSADTILNKSLLITAILQSNLTGEHTIIINPNGTIRYTSPINSLSSQSWRLSLFTSSSHHPSDQERLTSFEQQINAIHTIVTTHTTMSVSLVPVANTPSAIG
jgi:hypothetical protein